MKKSKNGFISMTLVYTFLVLFLFLMLAIVRTYTEKDKFLQAINDQIDDDIGVSKGSRVTVINKLIDENMPQSDANVKYFNVSNSLSGNGNGLFYMDKRPNEQNYNVVDYTDENADSYSSRIYYFRGDVENNHLVYAGNCFRIIRTNEDGTIRLRYNGVYTSGTCPTVDSLESNPSSISAGSFAFDVNSSSGNIARALNEWYYDHIISDGADGVKKKTNGNSYTEDTAKSAIYCNNRKVIDGTHYLSKELVPSYIDVDDNNAFRDSNMRTLITLKCENQADRIKYNYPVGLLTAQDVALAGGYLTNGDEDLYKGGAYNNSNDESLIKNTNYYLYSYTPFWTMSQYDTAHAIYVDGDGTMRVGDLSESHAIIPVISLNSNIGIETGNGTYNNPYIVRK